ncbi:MAG TPA: hypothetical protein VFQ79_15145 [Bryobacteraceae bacterium]|nr:hypothetical protein [Bryobacteraceae bacterium]
MKLRIAAATVFLAWSWQTAFGQVMVWDKMPGRVIDISGNVRAPRIGEPATAGGLWALGIERVNASGFKVFRFSGGDWVRDYNAPSGRRLAAGPDGDLFILDDQRNLHRYAGGSAQIIGQANDVAVGADGSVWIISTLEVLGGFRVSRWNGSAWMHTNGGAVRIAVDREGSPWVVNDAGKIFRYNTASNQWELKRGTARSVHTGARSGAVWMLGADPIPGGFPIYQWNAAKQDWDPYGSYGAVAITEWAAEYIVQSDGTIYKATYVLTQFTTIDITNTVMPLMTPQAETPVRVSGDGKLLCSAADSGSATYCGNTNADYVGGHTLNLDCKEGFYDLIYGGTCWKCPDDTDGKGAWIRSGDAVDKDTACWRVPNRPESTAHAIKVKSPAPASQCPSGSFWDGYSPDGIGGSCWKCPDDHPRRTAAAVWAGNACATSLNETRPATLLSFNGCPTPDAAKMGLAGKRSPGKPFLDIAARGCFACPITDEEGNFLLTDRNGNPLYNRTSNDGCRVNMKWQPFPFREPGLAYMQGVKQVIWDLRLFDGGKLTGFLYDSAEAKGLGDATPGAKAWVSERWAEIAAKPYNSESFRAFMFAVLKTAARKNVKDRTPGEQKLIESFQDYIRDRRTYLAEQGLLMYDAWKAYNDAYRQETGQTKSFSQLFYYGTVPFDYHAMVGSLMGLGGAGGGVAGAIVAINQFASNTLYLQTVFEGGNAYWRAQETVGFLTSGLNLLKSVQGVTLLSGASVISIVGVILTSIAMDQFMAIETARPKLEASLAEAMKPVDLSSFTKVKNGEDMLYFFWAKAMDAVDAEDPQVRQLASQARARADQSGYQAPPKQLIKVTLESISLGPAVSSGTGTASPFSSPGLAQNEMLVSNNGKYEARMQLDGNFVIYSQDTPIWATQTHGQERAPYRLAMQPDGNLVVYGSRTSDVALSGYGTCKANSPCIAIWNTGPRGGTAPYSLEMQDDGNLVMYDNTHRPVWASGTNR